MAHLGGERGSSARGSCLRSAGQWMPSSRLISRIQCHASALATPSSRPHRDLERRVSEQFHEAVRALLRVREVLLDQPVQDGRVLARRAAEPGSVVHDDKAEVEGHAEEDGAEPLAQAHAVVSAETAAACEEGMPPVWTKRRRFQRRCMT